MSATFSQIKGQERCIQDITCKTRIETHLQIENPRQLRPRAFRYTIGLSPVVASKHILENI